MENFYSAYGDIELLYGTEITPMEFEEIGLIAWNKIGNKPTRLYRFRGKINEVDNSLQLPCNCDIIEAVTRDQEDYQLTSNMKNYRNYESLNTETFIEQRKVNKSPLYQKGGYLKFQKVEDKLYFDSGISGNINILYKGIIVDDDGLPYINEKEKNAIACYCAMTDKLKQGYRTNNGNIIQIGQTLKQDWERLKLIARQPISITQNEMNEILDAKSNWNRKLFNRSYKPIV